MGRYGAASGCHFKFSNLIEDSEAQRSRVLCIERLYRHYTCRVRGLSGPPPGSRLLILFRCYIVTKSQRSFPCMHATVSSNLILSEREYFPIIFPKRDVIFPRTDISYS
jgi:hypothetical protein